MEGDGRRGVSLGRIISKNPSLGYSSRFYYYRSSQGIPFNWEMQPGTPKQPQNDDILPPISPPPALLSLGLPKPRIDIVDERKYHSSEIRRHDKYHSSREMSSFDDGGFVTASSRVSSFSSSSLSFSFSNGSSDPSVGSSLNRYYGCGPLNFSSFRISRSR
ncbi:hypothetical protein V6N13_066435 [Hibiscus sabdariffa]|uniref:Uncharacterized protein n=1 Tax=Hibiscus sabdariffa TaxID=183260 RepID=A0ABR2DRP7_9ROSI